MLFLSFYIVINSEAPEKEKNRMCIQINNTTYSYSFYLIILYVTLDEKLS